MGWTLHGSIAPLSFIGQIPNSSRPLRNALPFPVWVLTLWAWLPLRWPGKTQKEVYIISMSKTGAEVHFRKHFNWWRVTLRWALQLIVIFCYCTCKVQTFWEVLCTAGKSAMQMPRWSQWSASSGNLPVPSGQHWEMHLKCLAWLPLLRVAKAPRPLSNSQVVHVRGLLSCRPLENPAKKQLLNGEKSSRPVELASFAESDFTARAAAQSLMDAPGRWSLRKSDKVINLCQLRCCSSMAQLGLVLYLLSTYLYSGERKHCPQQPDLILRSRNHKLKQFDAHWVGAPLKLVMEPENKQRRYGKEN